MRLGIFERRLASDGRIGAGAEAVGDLAPDLDLIRNLRRLQCLGIGIHGVKLHAFEPFFIHAPDGVGAASAHANHFDARAAPYLFLDFEFQSVHFLRLYLSDSSQHSHRLPFQIDLAAQTRRIHSEPRRRGPLGTIDFVRPIQKSLRQPHARGAIEHALGDVADAGHQRARARDHQTARNRPLHAGTG